MMPTEYRCRTAVLSIWARRHFKASSYSARSSKSGRASIERPGREYEAEYPFTPWHDNRNAGPGDEEKACIRLYI